MALASFYDPVWSLAGAAAEAFNGSVLWSRFRDTLLYIAQPKLRASTRVIPSYYLILILLLTKQDNLP